MVGMVSADRIEMLIAPSVEAMGYDLIRVRFTGTGRPVLQIMAERPDGSMNVSNCAEVSRAVSAILDVEDPITGEYELEVSSPGIDRPLVRLKDFVRFSGFVAKIETGEPPAAANGQRRFKGRITGVEGTSIHVDCDGSSVSIEYDNVASAKLVLTDELVEASLRSQ